MIKYPDCPNVKTYIGKKCRRRYRVSYSLFLDIVELCRHQNIFGHQSTHGDFIPIELKVLACLRVLAIVSNADNINDCSGIGESTINKFFHLFIENFVDKNASQWLDRRPNSKERETIISVYQKLGFSGCIGSVDCKQLGEGGYAIHVNEDTVLDWYRNAKVLRVCKTSLANDARLVFYKHDRLKGLPCMLKQNADVTHATIKGNPVFNLRVKETAGIKKDAEIFHNYGRHFKLYAPE